MRGGGEAAVQKIGWSGWEKNGVILIMCNRAGVRRTLIVG